MFWRLRTNQQGLRTQLRQYPYQQKHRHHLLLDMKNLVFLIELMTSRHLLKTLETDQVDIHKKSYNRVDHHNLHLNHPVEHVMIRYLLTLILEIDKVKKLFKIQNSVGPRSPPLLQSRPEKAVLFHLLQPHLLETKAPPHHPIAEIGMPPHPPIAEIGKPLHLIKNGEPLPIKIGQPSHLIEQKEIKQKVIDKPIQIVNHPHIDREDVIN